MKIINVEKKKMIPLTIEEQELHEETQIGCICKRGSYINMLMVKSIAKLWTIVFTQVNIEMLHIAYAI